MILGSLVAYVRGIGRRGAYLLAHGTLFVLYGFGLLSVVATYPRSLRTSYVVIEQIAPLSFWGALWMAVGVGAIVSVFAYGTARERLRSAAFAGLMGLTTIWALGFFMSHWAPSARSALVPWIGGTIFLTLMASIAVVAGWPEKESR